MAFETEKQLIDVALASEGLFDALNTDFEWRVFQELRGLFGRPDVVFTNVQCKQGAWFCSDTKAIEAKLRNWRKALKQAFRYRSFADVSYVLLDHRHCKAAVANLDRFIRANVGLITIDDTGSVHVFHHATPDMPYCPRITDTFRELVLHDVDTKC